MLPALRSLAAGGLTAAHAVAAIAIGLFDRGGRCSSAIVGSWARSLLRVGGVRLRIEGREHLPLEGPVLFVATHRSLLDVPALYAVMPPTTRFVAKRELFRIPLFGQAIKLLGFVPIDRGDKARARRSLDRAARAMRSDRSLAMFPEGTRNPGTGLLPLKKGAFALALQHGLPLVPIACLGGDRCLPLGSLRIRPGTMTLRVGETFRPGSPAFASRTILAGATQERLLALLDGA